MTGSLTSICRLAAVAGSVLIGQNDRVAASVGAKHEAPVPAQTLALMRARDKTPAAPILIRTYKKEAELEVWKQARNGRFVLLKTFPICRWSGQLGPKTKQGDRQAPEGFYSVMPKQMNPNSAHYLSFDIGFPNSYDKAHGASGSYLMVHGTCSSAGCYAMTDDGIREIYAIAREAFAGGQKAFQFQAFPFRMTAENMGKYRSDPNIAFWWQLKEGADRFDATGEEPLVSVAAGRYAFRPFKDAAKEALASGRVSEEKARVATLIADGAAAVRTAYADGGQHPSFVALARRGDPSLGVVSRPETLAFAGRDVVVIRARPKPGACGSAGCPDQAAQAQADQAKHGPHPALIPQGATIVTLKSTTVALPDGDPAAFAPAASSPATVPLSAWSMISGAAHILPGVMQTRLQLALRS